MTLTIGSLFSGFGGLDMAVADAFGDTELAWVCDYEPGPGLVLAHHHPDIPNHGDVHDLSRLAESVDILAGGYPCPGESAAGKRLGTDDPRWLWPQYRALIRKTRPRWAVGENVRGHTSKSLLMGAPEGWICDVPGITRNLGIRLAGNGVVRQQGAAALTWLRQWAPAVDVAVGNAVTPNVAEVLVSALVECITGEDLPRTGSEAHNGPRCGQPTRADVFNGIYCRCEVAA